MARVLERLRARARPSIGIALVCVGVLLAVVLATGGTDEPDPPPRAGDEVEPVRACERVEETVAVRRRARAGAEFTAREELSARETATAEAERGGVSYPPRPRRRRGAAPRPRPRRRSPRWAGLRRRPPPGRARPTRAGRRR